MLPLRFPSKVASIAIVALTVIALAIPKPTLAAPTNAFQFLASDCEIAYGGVEFEFLFSVAPNENRIDNWTIFNARTNTSSYATAGAGADSSGQDFEPGSFVMGLPADTQSGDTLNLTVYMQSTVGQDATATYTFKCGASPNAVTWFNPGDGRVDGRPGDRIVVWCNTTATPPNLVVYGVGDYATNGSHGFLLGVFNNADLLKVGTTGMTKNAGTGNGTISAMQDGKGDFYVAWNGGIFHATGQGDFAKSFSCQF